MLLVGTRAQKALEYLSMQIPETIRSTEAVLTFIVIQQEDTKVIVSHIRGKIVADNSLNTIIGLSIKNTCFQYLNQGQRGTPLDINICFNRNNIEFNRITVAFRIIPMR